MEKSFNLTYQAKIIQKQPSDLHLWFSDPQDDSYQKIKRLKIKDTPTSSYKDQNGNNVLYFHYQNTKSVLFKFDISVLLKKDDDASDKTLKIKDNFPDKYIETEKFLEQTELTRSLSQDFEGNDVEFLKFVMDYIVKKFRYCYPVPNRGVKNLSENSLSGDCGEYSGFFVATARKKGIPARNETGFVLYPKEKTATEHAWASVLTKNGWKDFDPQYAQLDRSTDLYFGRRADYRVVFSHGFNIPLKPKAEEGLDFSYWQKVGLPASKSSVQILQPIFFISSSPVEVQDSFLIH